MTVVPNLSSLQEPISRNIISVYYISFLEECLPFLLKTPTSLSLLLVATIFTRYFLLKRREAIVLFLWVCFHLSTLWTKYLPPMHLPRRPKLRNVVKNTYHLCL